MTEAEMLVISGPNGSGKTTLAEAYAAQLDYPYLGADKIAAALDPNDSASQSIAASRKFSELVKATVAGRQSVVIESTFSGRTFVRTLEAARRASFSISLVHLYLDSADICVARVKERVQKGGHHVPEADIRRRYARCAVNFWELYRPLCDRWLLLYNSATDVQPIAEGSPTSHSIRDRQLYDSFMKIAQTND